MSVQRHSWEPSSSSSSVLPWGDLEGNFAALQRSIETRLKELEVKESQVNDRLRELESKEREINAEFSDSADKNLVSSLSGEHERLRERVRRWLGESEDPARVVLGVVGDLYGGDLAVVVLGQLAEIGPGIGAAERAEAARLAREWRARIRDEDSEGRSVSEVMAFLLLVGAYGLVDEFDSGDMYGVFRSIGGPRLRGEDSNAELGWVDHHDQVPVNAMPDIASAALVSLENSDGSSEVSQEKTNQSLEEALELVSRIATAFNSPFDALECFCVDMDGMNLKLFLYQHSEQHDSWGTEVREALCHAPDPAKLVLQAVPGFLRSQPEFHKSLTIAKVRKSCILLLEQLMTITPQISSSVYEESLKLAKEWGSNLGQVYQRPIVVYGFLLLLAAYRLGPMYDRDELLRLLGIASQYKASLGLCQALGNFDMSVLIQSLIQKTMMLEAVDNIYAFGLVDKFPPVRLLKGYLNYTRKRIYKKGDQSSSQQKQAITKEITSIKTVIKYIAKYNLESAYPPGDLEKQILQLEIKKGKVDNSMKPKKPNTNRKNNVPNPPVSCASPTVDFQAKDEPSPKEDSQLDDQVVKPETDSEVVKEEKSLKVASNFPSTSPWPRLESFCINMYGKGFNIFSHKLKEEEPNPAVSSPASPWPELKSFCVNMDGKGLRTFVYDHIDENESLLCSEVCDALKSSSDPAKLVLDSMPGCLRSQPEFDETLKIKKVRNSRILLLEQLIVISPQINPFVREEALKMANEWRANLGFRFKGPDNVYGYLHFVAAYGLVSDFESVELVSLLGPANQHKVSPNLCRILGFANNASVVINHLLQMSLVVEAVEHIYAFEGCNNFSPPQLLKQYLKSVKARKDVAKPPLKKAIEQEIAAVRSVINCVTKYKLESELPLKKLERRIAKLEKKKPGVHDPVKVTVSSSPSTSSSFRNV